MRWSEYFIPTTKEVPKDATAASHVLMLRAGLIRQLAAGIYTYLPLGYRALRKVEAIVREEMDAAGAVELHMPVLQPLSMWEETGRTQAMGETLLRLAGPPGDWREGTVLGPTHEEVVTEIARAYLSSYRQLPINLYQIQTKFRGEARPKSGVLRTREFLMKDAYSFDADAAGLEESYRRMYEAYCRIFSRCGLPYIAAEAESGPIGGESSHEFMVLTEAGEDLVVMSEHGDYAANIERASAAPLPPMTDEPRPLELVHTPGAGRVEDVCRLLNLSPAQMIKTLVYDIRSIKRSGEKEIPWNGWVVALVRGDHEVNETKLRRVLRGALAQEELLLHFELASAQSIEELTGAAVGFAGPQGLSERVEKLIIDRDVVGMRNAASGANRTDYHVVNLNPGRDFPVSGDRVVLADIRNVVEGDFSPRGDGARLVIRKAIEVGHVFKLGTKYSEAMKATFLGRDGRPHPFVMGCYGIGLNRILAAAIEAGHDENGIIWPATIAPFEVLVIALDPREEAVMRVAGQIHEQLAGAGVDVLLDDRDERAGFKFKDADLIGIPYRIIVGRRSLAEGGVEFSLRRDGSKQLVSPEETVERAVNAIGEEQARLAAAC